ncbi:MAG: hypothetical protein QOJ14_509 [Thermoleophilaceae bacterium]|nr:hypothetical protein [Thermoleophilaceae bacterium]
MAPAVARADSDPASDILPTVDVFFPYQPKMSEAVKADLRGVTDAAKKAGYPIKVAIIATQADLGGVPQLFDQPARYAGYLGPEIDFNKKQQRLLVVMPGGLGTYEVGPQASRAIAGVKVGAGVDAMGRTAVDAVQRMAKADGHPIKGFKPKSGGSTGGGGSTAIIFAVPIALLVIGLAVMTYRRTDATEDEEEDEEDLA